MIVVVEGFRPYFYVRAPAATDESEFAAELAQREPGGATLHEGCAGGILASFHDKAFEMVIPQTQLSSASRNAPGFLPRKLQRDMPAVRTSWVELRDFLATTAYEGSRGGFDNLMPVFFFAVVGGVQRVLVGARYSFLHRLFCNSHVARRRVLF